jgi:hypothetical protein
VIRSFEDNALLGASKYFKIDAALFFTMAKVFIFGSVSVGVY